MLRDDEPDDKPDVLRLLIALDECGAVPVRHPGGFVGVLNAGRVPEHLWAVLDEHEGTLRRMLSLTPSPYRQRRSA